MLYTSFYTLAYFADAYAPMQQNQGIVHLIISFFMYFTGQRLRSGLQPISCSVALSGMVLLCSH